MTAKDAEDSGKPKWLRHKHEQSVESFCGC